MSETEYNVGTLTPVYENEQLVDAMKRIMTEAGETELESYYKSWEDKFDNFAYRKYYVIENVIYEVCNTTSEPGDIFEANRNPDGTISYVTSFYNGGCSFDEALDKAISTLGA